jgi:hypothetical protein
VNAVYYDLGDLDRIKEYCQRDVIVLAKLFLKLKVIRLNTELTVLTA